MPLLHRKPFIRTPPPAELNPTERLFYCRVTNEVFRDYDEFFERTILCNSLVWSCFFTGKSGLTYQEALESEKKVKKSLLNFPEPVVVPVLYLTTLANHQRVSDLCDDIYEYVKDRYFIGETVTVVRNSGARLECTILDIKLPPQENGMTNGHNIHSDTIVISDSDDESPMDVPDSWKKKEPIDPSLLKYKVEPVVKEMYESVTVKQCQVSRKSSLFSQERLKLFLKIHCEIQDGIVKPKASSIAKYDILKKNYFHYFPDEPPRFILSAEQKAAAARRHLRRVNATKQAAAAREKERILQHKRELKSMELEKERLRKERAERIQYRNREECAEHIESRNREIYAKVLQMEEFKKTVEVERLKKREEKNMIKLEREKEREKIREEKRKFAERVKMWNQRRDDIECDDLKDLPVPIPVKTRLPPDCFGGAIMVLEFLHAFGDLFDLKDEFPEGVTFEILEEALVGSDPEGPLCEILFFFLSAIFQALAEEEEDVANDQITDAEAKGLTEALGEDTDTTTSALYAVASLAAAWPHLNHGCSLKELDLDSCTLSEILRLHILASGAESNSANAKYRYQKQGGFIATDDACLELRINHPALLKKLSCTSVYDFLPDEKLTILHALCGKLLTLVSTRDYIEDCIEELRQVKQEFRELKAEQNRRERDEAAARILKRKEEKLKEQELKMKDKEDKLREDENSSSTKSAGNEERDDLETSSENKDAEHGDQDVATEDEGLAPGGKMRKGQKVKNTDSLEKKGPSAVGAEMRRKHDKKEQKLMDKMQHATACTNIIPLGRDRWYRRFWTFFSIPGLFVEEDYTGITEDMLEPQPLSERETENNPTMNGHDSPVKDTEEKVELPKPVDKPNRWSYYSTVEQLDELIECLNTRGHRESMLKDMLVQDKTKICQRLSNFPANRFHISDSQTPTDIKPARGRPSKVYDSTQTSGEKQLELRLCELLLDIEDRIYRGTLGSIKVPDRHLWRYCLETCSYELMDNETKENGTMKLVDNDIEMETDINQSNKDSLKTDIESATSTNANTPQPATNSLHYLAQALLQIEQGVERKYLKAPLGDAEDNKKNSKLDKRKDDKKKKDEDQTNERDDASDGGRVQRTVLDRWRESLLSSSALSQIFLNLSTLERSILWSRSIRNARCKVCRKKGDGESMILCDGCERGHHIFCVRPKLKFIPEGDWFCPDCRPRQRTHRTKHKRPSIDSDEEEAEDLLDDDVQQQSENENEETAMPEEESTTKKLKPKLQLPLLTKAGIPRKKPGPKKGTKRKEPGMALKSQQVTPKNNLQTPKGRGRGKKANSAPPLETKPGSRLTICNSDANAETPKGSLVELVSVHGQGRGRGRGRGRGTKVRSVDSTPVGSPFAFRPFTLDNVEQTPKENETQTQNSEPTHVEARGRGKRLITAEISTGDQGNRRSSGRHQGVHELSACELLVVELVRHEDSWPFMRLVSKIQVPDYFDIIRRPIALNIIREKVNKCAYSSVSEFVADVELMFSNCFEYNDVNSNEAKAGLRLQSFFTNEAQKLGLEVNRSTPSATAPPVKKSRI